MRLPEAAMGMPMDVPAYIPISGLIATGDFTFGSLAASVNSVPYIPRYLGALGVFDYDSEITNTAKVETDGQVINLIQSSAPGSPGQSTILKDRKVMTLTAPRIARTVEVTAEEVAGARQLAGVGLETVQTRLDRKVINAVRDIYSTLEYHRLGAVCGKLLDADATVLVDYFAQLGVSQPTQDMTLGTATAGTIQSAAEDILNALEDALGNFAPDQVPPVAICGRTFWKRFITHANVQDAYKYFQAEKNKNPNRMDLRYADFEFEGIMWRQYRGAYTDSANASQQYMAASEARIVVQDVPGTYLGLFCPPQDVMGQENTPGQPLVATVYELPHQAGLQIRIQSNPLHCNTRPAASIKLTTSN